MTAFDESRKDQKCGVCVCVCVWVGVCVKSSIDMY